VVLAKGSVLEIDDSLAVPMEAGPSAPFTRPLEEVERTYILRVLDDTDWLIEGQRGAAAILGLSPSTLRSRMQKLGIQRPRSRPKT
jgi:formate hydrogenlyase transcriptional activator